MDINMKTFCCEEMARHINYDSRNLSPDEPIYYSEKFDEYGISIFDGGSSYFEIFFCPWCGSKLPESKRDLWFDTLEKLGYDDLTEQNIPEEFKSDKWYRK